VVLHAFDEGVSDEDDVGAFLQLEGEGRGGGGGGRYAYDSKAKQGKRAKHGRE
jgi:hypothetical protein